MANHAHKQIRDAVKAALTGLATTGTNVFANRVHALGAASLPALRLYLAAESAEPATVHSPHLLTRRLDLMVEACAKAVSGVDDTLDQVSKEVEIALAAGVTVGGQALEIVYRGMDTAFEASDTTVGIKRLRFGIDFETFNNAPDILS